jgi:hypothetical protein
MRWYHQGLYWRRGSATLKDGLQEAWKESLRSIKGQSPELFLLLCSFVILCWWRNEQLRGEHDKDHVLQRFRDRFGLEDGYYQATSEIMCIPKRHACCDLLVDQEGPILASK